MVSLELVYSNGNIKCKKFHSMKEGKEVFDNIQLDINDCIGKKLVNISDSSSTLLECHRKLYRITDKLYINTIPERVRLQFHNKKFYACLPEGMAIELNNWASENLYQNAGIDDSCYQFDDNMNLIKVDIEPFDERLCQIRNGKVTSEYLDSFTHLVDSLHDNIIKFKGK